MRGWLARGALAALAAIIVTGSSVQAQSPQLLHDDFGGPALATSIWWPRTIPAGRFWIDPGVLRGGRRSLAIAVEPGDRDPRDASIQRNEIWLREDHWQPIDQESWYAFSFRMESDVSQLRDARWVIGQWKEDGNRSPFLAQRFNGGVFRITIQDNSCQQTIAVAMADAVGPRAAQATMAPSMPAQPPHSMADMELARGPRMPCTPDVSIAPGETHGMLPSPVGAWVDMVYRVRRGRNGRGLVQVWANGRSVVTARGSIGNDGTGPRTYFKIGMYRDPMVSPATLYFADFRRGVSRTEVDPAIAPPR
jgi:hypothetical protein